jgi:signal transduction histidine kinase
VLFILLLVLSRVGYFKIATAILLALYYTSATYSAIRWGVELPLAGFTYVLTIIIASVLVGTGFGFFFTTIIALTLVGIGWAQVHGFTPVMLSWKYQPIGLEDPIEFSILLFLIMTVSWLSNREVERSLVRARKSEHALKIERGSLELKVEERTKALRAAEHEKLTQLYRFAEFGKISSGIFHDLMNPLNALIANINSFEKSLDGGAQSKQYIVRAVNASRRMGALLGSIRKQMGTPEIFTSFPVKQELDEAIAMLEHRILRTGITLNTSIEETIYVYGNPLKFHQIAINLIANAIDAIEEKTEGEKQITISLTKNDRFVTFAISDTGGGIDSRIKDKIFTPFFTTKTQIHGLGLGLSTTKEIIKKDFLGTITVSTEPGRSTTFTVVLPISHEKTKEDPENSISKR